MGIYAELVGNVLASPTMKQVTTPNGAKRIVELRIMSASYRRLGDGSLEQKADRTFPVHVTIWNERNTERVMQHIRTGASVVVKGDLYVSPWIARENEAMAGVHIDAESIALNLVRVDQVIFHVRQGRNGDDIDSAEPDAPPNYVAGHTDFDRSNDESESQSASAA
jgi:single-strand DNA-binding protein